MAVVITRQPSNESVVAGAISSTLSVVATGATSYQWKQAKDATTVEGATVVAGQNTNTMTIPAGLSVGTYYFFCAVSDEATTVNSNIAIVTVVDFPEYITGAFVHAYMKKCSKEAQERFKQLQILRGITIPDDDNVLRTAQVELFMEAI